MYTKNTQWAPRLTFGHFSLILSVFPSIFRCLSRPFFHILPWKLLLRATNKRSKKILTKKIFGFFFPGKGNKWTRKLVILKADFQPTSQFVADAMGIKWKPYFRGLIWYMPRCAEMRGNLSKLTFFGPENSTKKALFQGLFFGFFC